MAEPGGTVRDPEAVSRFVEHFAAQLVEAGLPRMPARVFVALLASDDGVLTSAELSERLRISPAAVSGAVRYLARQHMVSREREPGSRRERYRVHGDQWYEALTNREAVIRRWEGPCGTASPVWEGTPRRADGWRRRWPSSSSWRRRSRR